MSKPTAHLNPRLAAATVAVDTAKETRMTPSGKILQSLKTHHSGIVLS